MKKLITFLAFAAVLAAFAVAPAEAQGKGQCPVVGHGTVNFVDVSGGCWQFVRDDGTAFELVTARKLKDGATGTLHGRALDVFTICMVGQPTEVCRFAYDKDSEPTVIEGTLVKGVESGCWLIATASDDYLILNCSDYDNLCLASNEGRVVRAAIAEKGDVITLCMQGTPVDVLSFEWTDEAMVVAMGAPDADEYGQGQWFKVTLDGDPLKEESSSASTSTSAACESACLIACTLECRTFLGPAGEHTPEFMECFNPCLLRVQACQKICEENAAEPNSYVQVMIDVDNDGVRD